jgi:hypothetical protein
LAFSSAAIQSLKCAAVAALCFIALGGVCAAGAALHAAAPDFFPEDVTTQQTTLSRFWR